jgi:hypothetical protein
LKYLEGSGTIKGGKKIHAYMCAGDGTEVYIGSNLITSDFRKGLPENCAGRYMTLEQALSGVHKNQRKLIELYASSTKSS